MISASLSKVDINVDRVISECGSDSDGAVVAFIGRARDHTGDRRVTHLEYEAYGSMAERELARIAHEALRTWPFTNCIIVHRQGIVNIGEASVIIAVSSPHRGEALESTRYIIDHIKKRVPIWKKEYYEDSSCWITDGS